MRHSTLARTLLDEGKVLYRDLYLTAHDIHRRQNFMVLAGLEPAIPASERP
jgi:hypothetical protein